jgi:protein ImuB
VQGSLKLFGGLDNLLKRIRTGLIDLGFTGRLAVAPSAYAAWLLARYQDGVMATSPAQLNRHLGPLPITFLPAAWPHQETLKHIGAHNIKDLLGLPRPGLARRFGKALLVQLDQALGTQAQAHAWNTAPLVFEQKLELMARVDTSQALMFVVQRLVLQLSGWLGSWQAACQSFSLHIMHEDKPPSVLQVQFAELTRDPVRLCLLAREKLEKFVLPAPAHELALHCQQLQQIHSLNAELFPSATQQSKSLAQLLERLQNRLGEHQISMLHLTHDHRPEAAYKIMPVQSVQPLLEVSQPLQEPVAAYGPGLPRPLWLLAQPVPLSERNNRPWWQGPLHVLAGPERIESGWWDGQFVERDYFVAEDTQHVLYWIFCERLPAQAGQTSWYMQGRFG